MISILAMYVNISYYCVKTIVLEDLLHFSPPRECDRLSQAILGKTANVSESLVG